VSLGYNYDTFDMAREDPVFAAFRTRLHVTERAPSFELEDLATGQPVALKKLWAQETVILEFGSFT